jgi:hypothetical protein
VQKAHLQPWLITLANLPGAHQGIVLPAAAAHREQTICAPGVGLELLNKQTVVKGGAAGVESAEKVDPLGDPLNDPFRIVLHPALLRPITALLLSVAAAAGPVLSTPRADAAASALVAQSDTARPTLRGEKGNYTATVFVAASPKRAWTVLTNYEAMAGVMPDIKDAKVLRRKGSVVELQQTYQAPYTFGRRITAVLSMRESAPRQLRYELVRGDQIRALQGSWTITPVKGGVILRHQIQIDPVVPSLVRPVYYELTEANLLQSMRILKRLIEQA